MNMPKFFSLSTLLPPTVGSQPTTALFDKCVTVGAIRPIRYEV